MMRKFILAMSTVGASALVCAGASAAPTQQVNRPEDVRKLLELEVEANSDPTMAGFASYLAVDGAQADLSAPGWYQSRAQYVEAVKQQFDSITQLKAEVNDSNVITHGNLGCVATQMHIDGTMKDGSSLSVTFRALNVWKKIEGRWQYKYSHLSFPLDPATGSFMKDQRTAVRSQLGWGNNPVPGPAISIDQAKAEIARWIDASAKVSSVDDLLRYLGPDENIIFYDVGKQLRGKAEIHAHFAPIFAAARAITVTTPASFVDSDGLIGAHMSRQDVTLIMKDGSSKTLNLRRSDCLRRVDGRWYAMLSMISLPTARVNWSDTKSITATTEKAIIDGDGPTGH